MRENEKIQYLEEGLRKAFVDRDVSSNLAYKPQFLSNNYQEGAKVLSAIEDELLACDRFFISVAFITMSGITPLLQTFRELEKRNIPGKILTTNYLNFSEPQALEKLASLHNIEVKMYHTEQTGEGFHTKGYIFQKEEIYRIIVGSSNLTLSALTKNKEWNTKIVSTEKGEYTQEIVKEFQDFWESDNAIKYDDFIETYRLNYEIIRRQREIVKKENIPSLEAYRLKPNSMQLAFINNLRQMLERGEKRALLLSATGTGKTYASAFAMRELGFKKVLFLVHRNQIAKQALQSYRRVFGNTVTMGMVSGALGKMETDKDYIFATIQTLCKDENLEKFSPDYFDAVIYDEAHHTSAKSYKRVMEYFSPRLSIGMTATPDKRDDNLEGRNIYQIFNHNIAYEIRLQQAMEEDLLCPFHYFGITDLEVITDDMASFSKRKGSHKEDLTNFRYLVSDKRVEYVLEQARYYGYSGTRVKGLIFCSRIEEAKELSAKFNQRGLRTMALSGADSEIVRSDAVLRLTMEEEDATEEMQPLDYIISVDIFSEGTDVPEINQVIMLRPTTSPIVFIQQLGRGLRKAESKEYVVVLDFIGNYKNNFMIPIALSGDRSYNKDTIRRYVMEGSRVIPGSSSIHFDEISKKKIYEAIDKLSTPKKMLIEKYNILKDRLGKIPSVVDFYNQGEVDPLLFISYAGSYPNFLKMADKEYEDKFSEIENMTLEFISQNLANGKRIYELLILRQLIDCGHISKKEIEQTLRVEFQLDMSEASYQSALNVLEGKFMNTQNEKKKYAELDIVTAEKDKIFSRMFSYYLHIKQSEFIAQLKDLIELGIRRYIDIYEPTQDAMGLALYQKYSRKDVCRILNWEQDESSTVYGYKIKYNTCPIFVTYEKKEDISNSTKYEDVFLNNQVFSWMTRSRVSINSTESKKIMEASENGLKILLFVKKSDGEGTDFYYMGQVHPIAWKQTEIYNDDGKALPIMNFQLKMEQSVREDIYQYFVN